MPVLVYGDVVAVGGGGGVGVRVGVGGGVGVAVGVRVGVSGVRCVGRLDAAVVAVHDVSGVGGIDDGIIVHALSEGGADLKTDGEESAHSRSCLENVIGARHERSGTTHPAIWQSKQNKAAEKNNLGSTTVGLT